MNLNSAKKLSLINNVSCVSLTATGAISCASLAASDNISCASLTMSGILSITDTTQTSSESSGCLVLSGGIGIKQSLNCLGNANFMNNLACGTFSTTKITSANIYSPLINNYKYIRIAGYTTNTSGNMYHNWITSTDPTTTSNASTFFYYLQDISISMKFTYSYYETGGPTGASNGITEYYFCKSGENAWSSYTGKIIGSSYHPPTQTLIYDFSSGSSLYTVNLNLPSKSRAKVNFTYNITFY